jgi:hypothetical protein
MVNDSKREAYGDKESVGMGVSKVLGLGLISAVSAVAGGVAVAWWYRKTLSKLQNPIAEVDHGDPEHHEFEEELPE